MTTTAKQNLPLWERMIYAIPLLGWMIKDVVHGAPDNIYWFIASIVLVWIISGLLFGYPGVIIPALILGPAILVGLVVITRG